MTLIVTVKSLPTGWQVESDGHETLVFRTGAAAERAAKRLSTALAAAGHASEIRIYLRNGKMGGRFVCAASELEPARS